ncbi:hypothetical protein ACJ41O_009782 [Fusarium nematophilum]
MLLSKILVGLVGMVALVEAVEAVQDLGATLRKHEKLSTYYKLIQKYPEVLLQMPSYRGVTIVAPSNDAFDQIPYSALADSFKNDDREAIIAVLQYHVLKGTISTAQLKSGPAYVRPTLLNDPKFANVTRGQNILITKQPDIVVFSTRLGSRASVINNDIEFQGGLIQVVDSVLVPPSRLEQVLTASKVRSFLGGLYASKLMPGLADRKNITVFAPRNQAMEAIGGTLHNMDARELARVMGYHVVPDRILVSSNLTGAASWPTLTDGKNVRVRQIGNEKYVNSAKIIDTDILLANGILHIISNVNNPDDPDAVPDPDRWAQKPVFSVSEADNPFSTAIPCLTNCMEWVSMTPKATATHTPEGAATPTSIFSRSSTGIAAARATAHVAGAALGLVGAGMAML